MKPNRNHQVMANVDIANEFICDMKWMDGWSATRGRERAREREKFHDAIKWIVKF